MCCMLLSRLQSLLLPLPSQLHQDEQVSTVASRNEFQTQDIPGLRHRQLSQSSHHLTRSDIYAAIHRVATTRRSNIDIAARLNAEKSLAQVRECINSLLAAFARWESAQAACNDMSVLSGFDHNDARAQLYAPVAPISVLAFPITSSSSEDKKCEQSGFLGRLWGSSKDKKKRKSQGNTVSSIASGIAAEISTRPISTNRTFNIVVIRVGRRFIRRVFNVYNTSKSKVEELELELSVDDLFEANSRSATKATNVNTTHKNRRLIKYAISRWDVREACIVRETLEIAAEDVDQAVSEADQFAGQVVIHDGRCFIRRMLTRWDVVSGKQEQETVELAAEDVAQAAGEVTDSSSIVVHEGRRFVQRYYTRWDLHTSSVVYKWSEYSHDDLKLADVEAASKVAVIVIRNSRRMVRRIFVRWNEASQTTIRELLELATDDVQRALAASAHPSSVIVARGRRFVRSQFLYWEPYSRRLSQGELVVSIEDLQNASNESALMIAASVVRNRHRYIRRSFTFWDSSNNRENRRVGEMAIDEVASAVSECNSNKNIIVHDGRRLLRRTITCWDSQLNQSVKEEIEIATDDLKFANTVNTISSVIAAHQTRRFVRGFFTRWHVKYERFVEQELEIDEQELRDVAAALVDSHVTSRVLVYQNKYILRYAFVRWNVSFNQSVEEELELLVDDVVHAGRTVKHVALSTTVIIRGGARFVLRYVYIWNAQTSTVQSTMVHVMEDEGDNIHMAEATDIVEHDGRRYIRRPILHWDEQHGKERQEIVELCIADTTHLLKQPMA